MCFENVFLHCKDCTALLFRSVARLSRHPRNAKRKSSWPREKCKKEIRIVEMDPIMKRMRDLPKDHLSYSGNKHVGYSQYISCISRTSLCMICLKHRRRSKAIILIFIYKSLLQSVTYWCDAFIGSWYHRSSKHPNIK